jgi:hypothetical protein
MKTVQDYLNDPRILEEIRTIHAIRLKQHDETAGMSFEEQAAFHRKRTDAMFATLGLPPPEYVNLSCQKHRYCR